MKNKFKSKLGLKKMLSTAAENDNYVLTVKRKNANTASFVDKRHPIIILQQLYVKVSKSKNTIRRENKVQVKNNTYG